MAKRKGSRQARTRDTTKSPDSARPKANSGAKRFVPVAAVLAVAAVVALWFAMHGGGEPAVDLNQLVRPGEAAGFNLLLVTLDTVRPDHLGCYGHGNARTPTIDALAVGGLLFEQAATSTPLTLPSHTTMLTGLCPPRHGVRGNGNFQLQDRRVTLAEMLKAAGYDTAAFISCFVLDERYGLNRGFDTYDFDVAAENFNSNNLEFNRRPAEAVSDAAIRWLHARDPSRRERPFFMWVHYFDAHKPYESPFVKRPEFAGRPYDAQIAYVDLHLKRLLSEFDQLGLRDKTVVAIVSDHGEGLEEHDEPTHGLLLYDATVHVAFILSSPAIIHGPVRVKDRMVSLEDLFPTLADLLGVKAPAGLDGASALRLPPDPDRAVYIETLLPMHAARCSPLHGLRRLGDKYVRGPEPEYFDLQADPGELKNLIAQRATQVSALDRRLTRVMDAFAQEGATDGLRTMSEEERRRLGSLGYVQAPATEETPDLPDPKAMLRANRKVGEALRALRAQQLDEALQSAQEAVRECPAFADTAEVLAMVCEARKDLEGALAAYKACFTLNPKVRTALQMARILLMLNRFDEMEELLSTAERLEPDYGSIFILRGDRFAKEGRRQEAIAQYEHALQVDEHRVGHLVRPQLERLKAAGNTP